ncbi:MAG TPA: prepilin-type N-terminal cleavage/methylation domain-containing protein [Urbifossiella sp.]|nr:prepilin-type N-terminal cleavage/methylation domain-containing protein [Urbifossiella sp.]
MILTPATQRRLSRRAGFTLLEVLVVVAILVILSTVAIVATTRYLEDARKGRAQLQCRSLSTAIESYKVNAANPTFEEPTDLGQLLQPPFGGTAFLKNGDQDLIDPWGQQYQMKQYGQGDGTTIIQVYTFSKNDGTPISQFGIGPLAKVN